MKRIIPIFLSLLFTFQAWSQLGGNSVYRSLSLASAPRISALGGSALGIYDGDLNLAMDNPAFIQSEVHRNLSFNNNFYFGNINYGAFAYGHCFDRIGTFAASIKYVAYGEMEGRDPSGNVTGTFRAGDYTFNIGYGGNYKEKFLYGANLKLIYSHLETYNSVGVAADFAGAYHNEAKQFTFTAILRNAGFQLKAYTEEEKEPLPLEVSLGLSKKFKNIPVRLNIVVHNLQEPDLSYNNPELSGSTNIFGEQEDTEAGIVDKIFRHFIFGTEIDIAKPISIRLGYNHQIRQEIALPSKKGFAGITVGTGLHIKQFSIDYAFTQYHAAAKINHLGITVDLNEFLGKGKKKKTPEEGILEQ